VSTKSKGLGRGLLILRVTVAVGAMALVFRGQNWAQLARIFMQMNLGYFILSVAVFVLGQVLLATRWWLLLRVQGIPMAVGTAIKLHLLGLFYNNVMPSSMGGDLLRAWYVTKHTDKQLVAALSVFVDRVIAMLSMLLMVLGVYIFLVQKPLGLPSPGVGADKGTGVMNWIQAAYWILGGILLVILGAFCYRPSRHRLLPLIRMVWDHLVVASQTIKSSVILYCKKPHVVLATMGLTILLQSLIIITFWVLGHSLGIQISLGYYFIVFPVTWLVSALPISIAGIGLMEGGIVMLFTHLAAVPEEQAKALALCQRFVWVLASVPGGVIHLLGAHLPRPNSFDGHESTG
jgi:glycosyltransferase 2 family protein